MVSSLLIGVVFEVPIDPHHILHPKQARFGKEKFNESNRTVPFVPLDH